MRKSSFVDCIILEVFWQCLTELVERRRQPGDVESFYKSNPATPWLIVQEEIGKVQAAMQEA